MAPRALRPATLAAAVRVGPSPVAGAAMARHRPDRIRSQQEGGQRGASPSPYRRGLRPYGGRSAFGSPLPATNRGSVEETDGGPPLWRISTSSSADSA